MFVLCCDITIGSVSFQSVHEVLIKRSVHNLAATAVVKVPVTAVLKHKDEPPTYIETASAININDPVTIKLGYDGILQEEFKGYVKNINYKKPLEIECEDEFHKTHITCRFSEKSSSLRNCLSTILPEIKIGTCIDVTLKNYPINDKPGSAVLEQLKKDYNLLIFFDLEGNLHLGQMEDFTGPTVKYRMGYNVIQDNELKNKKADKAPLKVVAICNRKDGEQLREEEGIDGGETKIVEFSDVESSGELKKLAIATLKKFSYDGCEGKIQTFLIPYVQPCMVAEIDDPVYPERNGSYKVVSVETHFGFKDGNAIGGRRTVEIGIKA